MAFWTLDRVAALPAMPRFSVEVREIDGKRMKVMTCMDAKIAWVEDDDVGYSISHEITQALAGTPLSGCRPLVLGSDVKLTFLDAHGRVCNQDLRMLPEGGSE